MMSKTRYSMLALLGLVTLTCTTAIAQHSVSQSAPAATTPAPASVFSQVDGYGRFPYGHSEATQLAQQFIKSTKPDEKQEIRKKLNELLTKQFDTNVQQQQTELEDLEKQISELRSLLKRRQDAKSTIVERRIEQLIQEAEGLGWSGPGTNMPRTMYGGSLGGLRPLQSGTPAPAATRPAGVAR